MKYFYHLTEEKNIGHIMEDGLLPLIGPRACVTGQEFLIYACTAKYRRRWQVILGSDACIRIAFPDPVAYSYMERLENREDEWVCRRRIPPKYLTPMKKLPRPTPHDMAELAFGMLDMFSAACVENVRWCARAVSGTGDDKALDSATKSTGRILDIARRIRFEYLDEAAAARHLKARARQGEPTLCDVYADTKERLWEMLDTFPEIPGHEGRSALKRTLQRVLTQDILYTGTCTFWDKGLAPLPGLVPGYRI